MIALFELTYAHQLHAFELHFIHLLRKCVDYSKDKKKKGVRDISHLCLDKIPNLLYVKHNER